MKKLSKAIVLTSALALSLSTKNDAYAHSGHEDDSIDSHQYHENSTIQLPFDPMFIDENDNGIVDPEEIRMDNLNLIGDTNNLFSAKPIAALGLKKGQLALTIDDGPNPNVTPKLLDLLDFYGIKATFFVTGSMIKGNEKIIQDIEQRGHTIGNHTFSHNIPKLNASTIVGEVRKAHAAVAAALGHEPTGRLLFRAPGIPPKYQSMSVSLNNDKFTRNYIGPIHANLGADAPTARNPNTEADWHCWSHGVSAETCANKYYQQILGAGRGIILSHDVFYKKGHPNSYEMWKIILNRLHTEAGGIRNKDGKGVWEFVLVKDSSVLDQYDTGYTTGGGTPAPGPTKKTADGFVLISNFSKPIANVRSDVLAQEMSATPNSLINIGNNTALKLQNLVAVADLGKTLTVGANVFKQVRIEKTQPGLESLKGTVVYVWDAAL